MRRAQLDVHACQALLAGKYLAMREHWIGMARHEKKAGGALVESYVRFARAAHRAYCEDLTRALMYQAKLAERRYQETVRMLKRIKAEADAAPVT